MDSFLSTIGDIAEIYDGPHATPIKTDRGPYFLSISSLEKGRLDLAKSAHISEHDFKKWTKRVTPQKGDLLFSYETRLGEAALMPENTRACLGRRMGLLRPKKDKVVPEYLLYAYLSPQFQQTIIANTVRGATVDRIALNELSKFCIRIPKIDEQVKISHLLHTLDLKIELNDRINAELEAMAKTLYDYWFVQFDFPNANGKPYKTNGGKMTFNTTLKREIPERWVDLKLDAVLNRTATGLNPRDNFKLGNGENYYITIKDIEQGKINFTDKSDRVNDEALAIIAKRSDLQKGDVLFTSIEPVGITYLLHEKPKNWDINESVFTIRANPSKITSEFLFMLLSGNELKSFTGNSSSGSIHKGIRHGVLKSYAFAYSGYDLIEKFTVIIEPILQKQHNIENENLVLKNLRDWLLPMLMNGQVKIQ
jgi:type I restriction enzyme, S subunit